MDPMDPMDTMDPMDPMDPMEGDKQYLLTLVRTLVR